MSSNNGTQKITEEFLDVLDEEERAKVGVLTESKKEELIQVLRDYMPEAQKFLNKIPRQERDKAFLDWILTFRVVEFKVEHILRSTQKALSAAKNRKYNKATQLQLVNLLKEIEMWLKEL